MFHKPQCVEFAYITVLAVKDHEFEVHDCIVHDDLVKEDKKFDKSKLEIALSNWLKLNTVR